MKISSKILGNFNEKVIFFRQQNTHFPAGAGAGKTSGTSLILIYFEYFPIIFYKMSIGLSGYLS